MNMKQVWFVLGLAAAVALTLVGGVLQGASAIAGDRRRPCGPPRRS